MRKILLVSAFLPYLMGYATAGYADQQPTEAVKTERVPSDIEDVNFIASYEYGPLAHDYAAQASSALADPAPYAVARGGDKGLIYLKDKNDRAVKRYTIPRQEIRAVVHVKYDMVVLDAADLVFTDRNLILIHTTTSNAGMFTTSDVYPLTYKDGKVVDSRHLLKEASLLRMLAVGVSLYRKRTP
jgi:hypothetical protein